MKLPDYLNYRWPPGTHSLFSGNNQLFGLMYYADFTQENKDAFTFNSIRTVRTVPSVWYKAYKSMKLTLNFRTNNRVMLGGKIIIKANIVMPVTFVQAANPYCYISHKL